MILLSGAVDDADGWNQYDPEEMMEYGFEYHGIGREFGPGTGHMLPKPVIRHFSTGPPEIKA